MKYRDALGRILQLTDYERLATPGHGRPRYDLRRVFALVQELGNPHLGRPTIHIAGTKGKGSTAAMCASVLAAQGYRVGLYTSPHLHTFRERISINSTPVPEDEFVSLVEATWPAMERVNAAGEYSPVTVFELLTAMAFVCFARHSVQFQVVEVGLGGRLDATNVVTPSVAVITSLSLDHTNVLGSTLAHIAREKAGIIKPGCVVVSAPQEPEAMTVIETEREQKNAELVLIGDDVKWEEGERTSEGQACHMYGTQDSYDLWIPLLGNFQIENAATAVAALEKLHQQGHRITSSAIVQGLKQVHWPCRMEVLKYKPLIVADGAHNPYSMSKLAESLPKFFKYKNVVVILGCSSDKDIEGIADALSSLKPMVIAARSRHPRAADPQVLAALFHVRGIQASVSSNVQEALEHAQTTASQYDLILITGSLFIAAEAREAILGIPPELYPELDKYGRVSNPPLLGRQV